MEHLSTAEASLSDVALRTGAPIRHTSLVSSSGASAWRRVPCCAGDV